MSQARRLSRHLSPDFFKALQVLFPPLPASSGIVYSTATSSLAIGSSLSNSGTLGSQIGGTASSLSLNMANSNWWTALQNFTNASTSQFTATSSVYPATLGGNVGLLTTMFGVNVKKDANIPVTTTPSAAGGLFSQMGFLYVNELEPRVVMQTDDVSMREAIELNVWGSYGYGLFRPVSYGVTATFDATTPTD